MAADIFGRGLYRQIGAVSQSIEIERGRPGVVQDHRSAPFMCDFGNRRYVLYLEGERTGAFQEYSLGLRLELPGNIGADARVEIGRRNPVSLAKLLAEDARRPVNGIRHENVVAGRARCQYRKRTCRQ